MEINFDAAFEDFIRSIVLAKTQRNRIDQTLNAAKDIFSDRQLTTLQGSFATGTTVKPLTEKQAKDSIAGEYDADIAIVDSAWHSESSDSLDEIANLLEARYGDKYCGALKKDSCERVVFAPDSNTSVGFHADYVPLKNMNNTLHKAARSTGLWESSDTLEIIRIYTEFSQNHPFASSCLIMLKRWRDYNLHTSDISSIFLQACVLNFYEDRGSYVDDLKHLTNCIYNAIELGLDVLIVDTDGRPLTENLVKKIRNAGGVLHDLDALKNTLCSNSVSLDQLAERFSDDFPVNDSDYPVEIETLRGYGYSYDTTSGVEMYNVDTFHTTSGKLVSYDFGRRLFGFKNSLSIKLKITNRKELASDGDLAARWRVTNDPIKAKHNIRGALMSRNADNEFILKESAQYDGIHKAEEFVFRKVSKKIVGYGIVRAERRYS